MSACLENAVEAVERDSVRLAAESAERCAARLLWQAIVVSPTPEVAEALLLGEAVPVDALDREALARFLPTSEVESRQRLRLNDLPSVAARSAGVRRVTLADLGEADYLLAVERKAALLLVEGRVRIGWTPDGLEAVVQGDSGEYVVHLNRRGPSCSCPAYLRRCSHVRAVELVTGTRPEELAA